MGLGHPRLVTADGQVNRSTEPYGHRDKHLTIRRAYAKIGGEMCGVCHGLRKVKCLTCGREANRTTVRQVARILRDFETKLPPITVDDVLDAHEALAKRDHWTFLA